MASVVLLVHRWLLREQSLCSSKSRAWDKGPLNRSEEITWVKPGRRTHTYKGHSWGHRYGQWRLDFDTQSRCLVNMCLVNEWVHRIGDGDRSSLSFLIQPFVLRSDVTWWQVKGTEGNGNQTECISECLYGKGNISVSGFWWARFLSFETDVSRFQLTGIYVSACRDDEK